MCTLTSTLSRSIQHVVNSLVAAGKPFTAYDVTKEVRNRGCSEQFTHADVRMYIHELMDEYIDENEVTRQRSSTHPSWEYVPVATAMAVANANAPRKSAQINPVVTAITTMKQQQTAKPVVAGLTSDLIGRDKRNRVCLTKQAVASLGVKSGDVLYLGTLGGKALVTPDPTSNSLSNVEACYSVDKDGNVRICEKALARVGIPATQKTVLCVHSNSLIELM